jgi:hypothetical protein
VLTVDWVRTLLCPRAILLELNLVFVVWALLEMNLHVNCRLALRTRGDRGEKCVLGFKQ